AGRYGRACSRRSAILGAAAPHPLALPGHAGSPKIGFVRTRSPSELPNAWHHPGFDLPPTLRGAGSNLPDDWSSPVRLQANLDTWRENSVHGLVAGNDRPLPSGPM